MRIWSLHPKYLDAKGIVALWRETLLARKVLLGETKGYRNHPQLTRFKAQADPVGAIDAYLLAVYEDAEGRGYHFDRGKIGIAHLPKPIAVTEGQLQYELEHLKSKLQVRDPARLDRLTTLKKPEAHPAFTIVPGGIEDWERISIKE